ncbi:post-GPI attachment to proteins factor 3 [Vanessa atalanta]|uniref:post-GPI attachment to proteins factor 3 n=1 Tax=Vanessa atalanta TaxID=42275 RepID=UPI001FCD9A9D|nr:post-GPI attachment to proteins factor 3 [Vanessa atalanta]
MYKFEHNISIFVFILILPFILSSDGDRSPFYQNCVKSCSKANCTLEGAFQEDSAKVQDKWNRLLNWSCNDECRYQCMWRAVQAFQERGYQVPKFHGKWPFKRILGVQEPASAFASLLNLITHMYMYSKLQEISVRSTPHVLFWHAFAVVCMNAWIWSIIFHTRDTAFTEFMDYACALSMVMSLFIAAVVRILYRRKKLAAILLFLTLAYYVEHARYLYSGRIDYDYNMRVNIFFGAAGSLLWLGWAWRARRARRYAWRLAASTLLSGAALSLELLDFPPRRGCDAHALWHFSTAPLPLLFYRFVIDDVKYSMPSLSIKKST